MRYDYESRKKLAAEFQERWNRRLAGVSEEVKDLAERMERAEGDRKGLVEPPEEAYWLIKEEGMLPSRMMREHYGELVGLYVPEEKREGYYFFIDKIKRFNCTVSGTQGNFYQREDYALCLRRIFQMLSDYKVLDFYGGNLAAYLKKELPEELLDFRYHTNIYQADSISDLVAAAIDAQDEEVIRTLEEMFGGRRRTGGELPEAGREGGEAETEAAGKKRYAQTGLPVEIDRDAVCGIAKSSDVSLYELLGRFLLSAGMQDGIREKVCRWASWNGWMSGTARDWIS